MTRLLKSSSLDVSKIRDKVPESSAAVHDTASRLTVFLPDGGVRMFFHHAGSGILPRDPPLGILADRDHDDIGTALRRGRFSIQAFNSSGSSEHTRALW